MKPSLLKLLVCPACASGLDLRVRVADGLEVVDGSLLCRGCAATYPVLRGVPRFVEAEAYGGSFGRQWRWFRRVQLDSASGRPESAQAFAATTGWRREDLAGRLVLDAGVGAGRFADVAAAKGAEVVGVDISMAVDAAYENLGRREGVHLVQADIFALPFRPATFDLAYSIGVLHHTPDPRAAFERVAAVVRPGGALAVYLYAAYGPARRFADAIRTVTTRVPLPVMLALSSLAVPLYPFYRIPGVGRILRIVCPISLHRDWRWRWLDTFDWYTPRYQWKFLYPEIHRWFRSAGFRDVEVFDEPIRMRGIKAAAPASPAAPQRPSCLRAVALGGGTGLPVVLRGLKETLFPPEWRHVPARGRDRLTAIVTVADDGGSSGRLRRAYNVLAPGDVRNCLLALAESDGPLSSVFGFRFDGVEDVGGHSLGNLILTALSRVEGEFSRAVERAGEALAVRGRVLPSTNADVTLVGELEDGTRVSGESRIAQARGRVRRLHLLPEGAAALPQALEALRRADLIVVGPGSLYTSLLPNLLVGGVAEAMRASSARVVLVMNLMTQPGETDGYTAADHVRALRRHVPGLTLHDVLVNDAPLSDEALRRYAVDGAAPVECAAAALRALGCRVVERDLLGKGEKVRHDPRKLAEALVELGENGAGRGAVEVAASA